MERPQNYVNHQVNGSQWVSFGTYTFRADHTWSITLSNNANNTYVIAER